MPISRISIDAGKSAEEKRKRVQKIDERVMDCIEVYLARNRVPPTFRYIQEKCEIASLSQVYKSLARLERDGYIKKVPGKAAGIRLTDKRMFF